jgi:hypothetical protein
MVHHRARGGGKERREIVVGLQLIEERGTAMLMLDKQLGKRTTGE